MIQFKKVILCNFGSYGHAELELQNKGFCLVSGQNFYIKDNALSNGAGKSFLWSAICFALTGETINGIKTNLKNINTDEQECFVQLDFLYNKNYFSITRYVAPKSDLKIFKNDVDLSGKGIRESEKKLQELIPELNKDLIASTIIIGQGMPNKFSSFSPSGRKELLEKLTKSDFMIEDLKQRILARQQELSTKLREFEDSLLVNKAQLNEYLSQIEKLRSIITEKRNYDCEALLHEVSDKIIELNGIVLEENEAITRLEQEIEAINAQLVSVSEEKSKVSGEELQAYTESYTKLNGEKTRLEIESTTIRNEINRLQSIVDTCPTCGQSLPNIVKPDTTAQEQSLARLSEELTNVKNEIARCNAQHQEYINQINAAFNSEILEANNKLSESKQKLAKVKIDYSSNIGILEAEKAKQAKLVYEKQNNDSYIKSAEKDIERLEQEVATLTNLIALTSLSKDDFDQRLSVIKKMDTLIRRDFRGYLLTNIISYIDNKAKDYCNTVFCTRELSLAINGNALDITYCGKPFDSLSGGEKQRVDLILQLAIRELLNSYLGLSANILVLDEVTDFLDKKSCQAVMHLLEKELQTVESVFIISHHAEELELPVDSEIKVIKNENGISELF